MVKHIFIFLLGISVLASCKQETKTVKEEPIIGVDESEKTTKQKDGLTLLSGEFIFYEDAAVLQTGHEVYGVKKMIKCMSYTKWVLHIEKKKQMELK